MPASSPFCFVAVSALALAGCGFAAEEDIERQIDEIFARAPIGSPFDSLPAAMKELGYACVQDVKQFVDRKGVMRKGESHYACEREQSYWLVCRKRSRAILLQHQGRLSNALVNTGVFC